MLRVKTGYVGLALVVCAALSACGKKEPSGQVVATLDGKEVTAIQLNSEMNGYVAPNAQVRKQAEQAALNQILSREAIAAAAKKAGVDKTPGFALKEKRLEEELLVQSWQEQLVKAVPPPTRDEVDKYVAAHPDIYSARKVLQVEQIRMVRPTSADFVKGLEAQKTMKDVADYLTANHVQFQSGTTQLDPLGVNPDAFEKILKLPPTEVFVIPSGNLLTINHIVGTTLAPVPNDLAVKYATELLKNQRSQDALAREFQQVIAAARKDVKYAKGYAPPAPAAAPAAAKPKAAAAPAAPTPAPAAPPKG